MEITLALELNGYKHSPRDNYRSWGDPARLYKNARGVEMLVVRRPAGSSLGSTDVKALDFITEILNGAHAG